MKALKALSIIYFFSLSASTVADFFQINIQYLLRIPIINVRLIDVIIIYIIFDFFVNKLSTLTSNNTKTKRITILIYIYLAFELVQLLTSFGNIDLQSQISMFLTTLSIIILPYILYSKISNSEIDTFIKWFLKYGSITMIIISTYNIYNFYTGRSIIEYIEDTGIRLSKENIGSKETISSIVLFPIIYLASIFWGLRKKNIVYILTFIFIVIGAIFSFHRGLLFTILVSTIYIFYLYSNSLTKTLTNILLAASLVIIIFVLLPTNNIFNPVDQVEQLVDYSLDVDNPNWDKGRSYARNVAINAWKTNIFFGHGYDNLSNYKLTSDLSTAHSFIITSLFHRGIIGTFLLISIILIPFALSLKIAFASKKNILFSNFMIRFVAFSAILWLIPFFTQEIIWEKYAMSIQWLYFGLVMKWVLNCKMKKKLYDEKK